MDCCPNPHVFLTASDQHFQHDRIESKRILIVFSGYLYSTESQQERLSGMNNVDQLVPHSGQYLPLYLTMGVESACAQPMEKKQFLIAHCRLKNGIG